MLLPNLRVTVKAVSDDTVQLATEQDAIITVPKSLLPDVTVGATIYVAADAKPLVSSETHAKDVLNEIIKE